MRKGSNSAGFTLVEALIYIALLSFLMLGVASSIRYFRTQTNQINVESQVALEGQRLNTLLRTKLAGGNAIQSAANYTSVNGNYCYQIADSNPVGFISVDISGGAIFQYRTAATSTPRRNAEPKLASTSSLGIGNNVLASSVRRSLSMWVKLSDTSGNDRVLFDYSPDPTATSYKMVVSVSGGNSVRVDMGMGWPEFVYSASNVRDGNWHHLVVIAGDMTLSSASPRLYLDGQSIAANTNTAPTNLGFVNNLSYMINLGSSNTASWSLGPVGLWDRMLSAAEISKLGRMQSINTDNAFWLDAPQASLSSNSNNVVNANTVNARTQQGFLLFKKDSQGDGQVYYKMYFADTANSCPDPGAADNPSGQGFTQLSDNVCASEINTSPLLIGPGSAGQSLGFQWRCKLTQNKQLAQAALIGGAMSTSIKKSEQACGIPLAESDFATSDGADTAYVIVDNFDPLLDLIAFQGFAFPSQMTPTTATSGEAVLNAPSGTSVTWYSDAANNVGMLKISVSPAAIKTKAWWVTNVFNKIKYKNRTNVYAAERKIVFALGSAWPIKACPSLGYKSSYHFYQLITSSNGLAMTPLAAYQDAYRNRSYFGMTGYLVNMRCPNEKDQVSRRVLPENTVATIGLWTTIQSSTDSSSSPDFSSGRESVTNGTKSNDSWTSTMFTTPSDSTLIGLRAVTAGNVQTRIIGGPLVDHNVIVLTDNTLCNGATSQGTSPTQGGYSWSGCTGINTITVNHTCNANNNATSPACQLQNQSGGNRQYGWWQPREPNKSGPYIYMGFTGDDYWDDTSTVNSQPKYLIEYGDHPWDALTAPTSRYKTAHATSGDSSTNLDPPNVATKSVKTVNSQYCQ